MTYFYYTIKMYKKINSIMSLTSHVMLEFVLLQSMTCFTPDSNKSNDKAILETVFNDTNIIDQYEQLMVEIEKDIELRVRYNHNIKQWGEMVNMFRNIFSVIKNDKFYTVYPTIEFVDKNLCILRIKQVNDNIKGNTKIMRIDIVTYLSFNSDFNL